jgi:hypothetical protein
LTFSFTISFTAASVGQELIFQSQNSATTPQPVATVRFADWWVFIVVLFHTTTRNSLWVNYRHPAKWGGSRKVLLHAALFITHSEIVAICHGR